VLWGHAMLSDALFEEIVGSCPTELSVLPDCMQLTTLPECGVVPPSYNSDRLRLSSMRPGDCTRTAVSSQLALCVFLRSRPQRGLCCAGAVWNETHWAYMVNDTAHENWEVNARPA